MLTVHSDVKMETNSSDMLIEDADRPSHRKANKPLMEKRRRARINRSLMELKTILVESIKKSTPGHSKWEKADILEMTVQYLQCLKNQQQATKSDPLSVGQFIAGFSECIRQIRKFNDVTSDESEISGSGYIDQVLQQKLTDFLLTYLKTFSDDATKALTQQSATVSPQCKIERKQQQTTSPNQRDSEIVSVSPTRDHP